MREIDIVLAGRKAAGWVSEQAPQPTQPPGASRRGGQVRMQRRLSVQEASSEGRGGAERGEAGVGGGVDRGTVDVLSRVLFLPFGASVLEPDLHLRLGEVE